MRFAFVGFLCALLVAACATKPDNPERRNEAAQLAELYLLAVSGADEDRGWSMLHPYTRAEWGAADRYIDAARAADWSEFEFRILEVIRCDDGVFCNVALDIPGGRDSVPAFLRSPDGMAVGIYFREVEGVAGNAEIMVTMSDLLRGRGGMTLPDP
jgi:hypothetical protein